MKFKDKWLACVSLGEQTFRTAISDKLRTFARLQNSHFFCLLVDSSFMLTLFSFLFVISFFWCSTDKPIWNSVSTLSQILICSLCSDLGRIVWLCLIFWSQVNAWFNLNASVQLFLWLFFPIWYIAISINYISLIFWHIILHVADIFIYQQTFPIRTFKNFNIIEENP